MGLTFEPLGKYVRLIDERNTDLITETVLGINIDKYFMPSVANVIGTDLSNYKLLRKGRFACNPMHVGRDGRLPVSRYTENDPAIVSPAYFLFEVIDEKEIEPEYLMLCFRRPDFDRMCWFRTDASVRGGITWDDVCALTIPVPPIEEQRKIVHDYQVITDRIELLKKINENLEEQANNVYSKMFGGYDVLEKNIALPEGWRIIPAEDVFNISIGKTPPREETECFTYNPDDVTWVSIADMKKANPFIIESTEKLTNDAVADYNVKMVPKNTVLLSFKMTVGRVAIADREMTTNEAIAHFPCSLENLSYTYCMLSNYNYLKLGSTSSITTAINSKIIKAMPILWPSTDALDVFSNSTDAFFSMMKQNAMEMHSLSRLGNMVIANISR